MIVMAPWAERCCLGHVAPKVHGDGGHQAASGAASAAVGAADAAAAAAGERRNPGLLEGILVKGLRLPRAPLHIETFLGKASEFVPRLH